MTRITSLQNVRVKDAVRLRDGRHRQKQGRILIEGRRELNRAVAVGVNILELFVCEPPDEELPECDAEIISVSKPVFEKLSFGSRGEGILGVAEMPRPKLDDAKLPDAPLVVVLEGVEKPGNVGAVLRSADAAGVSALIVADAGTDLFNPNTIRASLGAIFTVPTFAATATETLDWLRRRNLKIFAARVDGSIPYTQADYRGGCALVLGAEATGLTPTWTSDATTAIQLPMLGEVDSLNVSATAAVLFYEALRQRGS